MSDSVESLGPKREARLRELEGDIDSGLRAFVRVGTALAEIRDDHLYRQDYGSFGDYCQDRWELSRSRAYQLIEAAEVAALVSKKLDEAPNGVTEGPRTDSQARALAPLKEHPAEMTAAWKEAVKATDGRPTTADVAEAVSARLGSPPPASEPPTPDPEVHAALPVTPIQSAVRGSLPENEGTFHLTTGQLERLATLSERDDNGVVRLVPTGNAPGEIEASWRTGGERHRCALNRHGNSPPAAEGTSATA